MIKSPLWIFCGMATLGLAIYALGWLAGGMFIALFGMGAFAAGLVGLIGLGAIWAINALLSSRH